MAMNKTRSGKRRRLPAIDDIIRGSAVVMERVCGKPTCRCLKGHKHRSLYISQYHEGGQRMVYIPRANETKVLGLIRNYRIIKSAIHKASELNLARLAAGRKKDR
jgi:hypothetical protein